MTGAELDSDSKKWIAQRSLSLAFQVRGSSSMEKEGGSAAAKALAKAGKLAEAELCKSPEALRMYKEACILARKENDTRICLYALIGCTSVLFVMSCTSTSENINMIRVKTSCIL